MFKGRFSKQGTGLVFSDFFRAKLKAYIRANPNQPFELNPILPESRKQRGWFEAGLLPIITFYQEGMDYQNPEHIREVREWLKLEFHSEEINIGGKVHKIAKSTKNKLSQGFLETVLDWFIENYAPPMEAVDPKKYKHWKAAVYPYGGPGNYIDYLLELKILKRPIKNGSNLSE